MTDIPKFSRRTMLMMMPLTLAACSPGSESVEIAGLTMGTSYKVIAIGNGQSLDRAQLQTAIDGALAQVNQQMSNWDPNSEISQFNAYQGTSPFAVSPNLAKVMQAAETVHAASNGRFDTTLGPLIELWGFGAPGSHNMPTVEQIADAQSRSGHGNSIKVSSASLEKIRPEAQVYLSGIGKGFAADHVGEALKGVGVTDYMVEIGGDMYVSGNNLTGLPWQVGIELPASNTREIERVVGLSNLGLATSGDYRNFFEQDGTRFSHLIDPATGLPIAHKTASATVLAESAMLADAWATAFGILGKEAGLEVAAQHGIAVLFTERAEGANGPEYTSTASEAFNLLTA